MGIDFSSADIPPLHSERSPSVFVASNSGALTSALYQPFPYCMICVGTFFNVYVSTERLLDQT